MRLKNKTLHLTRIIISQPLSILRFSLTILLGKKLIGDLEYIYQLPNNIQYSLSNTWFTQLLPDTFFNFNSEHYNIILILIIISAISASLGVLGRLNLIILTFLSFYIVGIVEGVGVFDHHLSLPSQVIFVLALVPGSMKLSIDTLLIKYFLNKKYNHLFVSNNPKWGLNLILMLIVLTYFSAGISKLRYGNGINWLDGSTLSFYLKEKTLKYDEGNMQLIIGDKKLKQEKKWKDEFGFIGHPYANYQTSKKMNKMANYIASNKFLVIMLSISSVLFELLGFIVFINSKYRNLYLISAIIFHTSIGVLMGISFRQYRLICLCLIDWNLILDYIINKLNSFKFLILNKLSTR